MVLLYMILNYSSLAPPPLELNSFKELPVLLFSQQQQFMSLLFTLAHLCAPSWDIGAVPINRAAISLTLVAEAVSRVVASFKGVNISSAFPGPNLTQYH